MGAIMLIALRISHDKSVITALMTPYKLECK